MLANQPISESSVPANAEAVAQLQLVASSQVVDLQTIANVVRSDVGLTIRLLQCGAKEFGRQAARMETLDEVIIQLGLEQLRKIAAEVTLTCRTQRDS